MTRLLLPDRFLTSFPFLFAGLTIWAIRFLFVFASAQTICEKGWNAGSILGLEPLAALVAGTAVLAILLCAWLAVAGLLAARAGTDAGAGRFIAATGGSAAALAALAMAWEAFPALAALSCGPRP